MASRNILLPKIGRHSYIIHRSVIIILHFFITKSFIRDSGHFAEKMKNRKVEWNTIFLWASIFFHCSPFAHQLADKETSTLIYLCRWQCPYTEYYRKTEQLYVQPGQCQRNCYFGYFWLRNRIMATSDIRYIECQSKNHHLRQKKDKMKTPSNGVIGISESKHVEDEQSYLKISFENNWYNIQGMEPSMLLKNRSRYYAQKVNVLSLNG